MPSEKDDLLADLTPAQVEAVTHMEGPLLILAGAGSGKTRVITRRVAWLLRQGVRPSSILAITFTNKAAGEMKQRVETLVPGSRVWISTFHAFGARFLRMYADRIGIDKNFTIYDQDDRTKLIKLVLEDVGLEEGRFSPASIQGAISKAKNQLQGPDQYAKQAFDYFAQVVASVYPAYEKRLRTANAFDFDDLLYWPAMVLKNNVELRSELDSRFRYVMVDEYQDTNQAQYALIRALSVDYPNICTVGDPDQSIYGWRGSDIRNILDFERDFPSARVLTLSQNYRSTKAILHAASHLIASNRKRKPKDLVTENRDGLPVRVLTFDDGNREAEGIAKLIRDNVQKYGRNFRDHAVFVRINALTRGLEQVFVKERVPFQIVRGLAFFDRKENKDVLGYLRLLLNPQDDLSFERVVNEPPRGIGKVSLEHLRAYAAPREMSMLAASADVARIKEIKAKASKGLAQFSAMMAELSKMLDRPPHDVIREVLAQSGYRSMLIDSREDEEQDRLANVEELITAARQFYEQDESRTLADFLENVTLVSDVDGWDEASDCVSVMTMHAAKGLEFPVVCVMAIEQGILPHERSLAKEDQVEEERRLLFVGMTRAKEELYLMHARLREFRGSTMYSIPSMFLEELPPEVERADVSGGMRPTGMERWRGGGSAAQEGWREAGVGPRATDDYAEGVQVRHERYGLGRVIEVGGQGALRKVRVRFAKAGERTFLVSKAELEIVRPGPQS